MLVHTMGANTAFYGVVDYDDLYYGKQNLYHYILALSMLDHMKRNCVLLPLCIYGTVKLTQFCVI